MGITGTIDEIVYRNDENGYTVAKLEKDDSLVTIVGKFASLQVGSVVTVEGKFERNKFGVQYAVTSYQTSDPNTAAGIEKYLGSGIIRGVGPITAKRIVKKFGASTLEIMEYSPEKLADVKGISHKKAMEIGLNFREHKEVQNTIIFLQSYNITTHMAIKIYNTYGAKTNEIVKSNPYRLIEDVDGIGFLTADRLAKNSGISETSEFRIRAGLVYVLKTMCEKNGNTYIPKAMLIGETEKALNLPESENKKLYESALDSLTLDKTCKSMFLDGVEIVMLSKYYFFENTIAQKLCWLKNASKLMDIDVQADVEEYQKRNNITLHDEQKKAIYGAVKNGVYVITGGPGTGKTTIIKCILELFEDMQLKVALVAPTGRAAKRMADSTGHDAQTIHRLLEVNVLNNDQSFFVHNETNPLDCKVIICDEVSMVDCALMSSLLKAMPRDCKLILVGDKDQLPSVGAGNVLADILASGTIEYCMLTKIFRQDEKSLIITNAHLINDGKMPLIDNSSMDFFFESKGDPESICNTILDLVTSRLPRYLKIKPAQIQVLAPLKAGVCGIENLNRRLQMAINPPSGSKEEITVGQTVFRLGDKVMQITNNYDLAWERELEYGTESGLGVFNGDIGFIIEIDSNSGEVVVEFEDGRVCSYTRPDLVDLQLSYAITIHKSQGSEFDVIIIPAIAGPSIILTRNLIYTAVTRAKKMVVIVGEKQYLRRMVSNKYTATRFTLLKKLLIDTEERVGKLFDE